MTIMAPESAVDDIVETDLNPYDDGKDHLTHIINSEMNKDHGWWAASLKSTEIVNIARLFGEEVIALCGYKWVPVRNPEKYPVCQACFKIAEQIMAAGGE